MAEPVLTRLEQDVLRRKSFADQTQVLAAGATAKFYRQGATSSTEVAVPVTVGEPDPVPTEVPVYDSGDLEEAKVVQMGVYSGVRMMVTQIVSRTLIKVLNLTADEIYLGAGTRLLLQDNRPAVYSDPHGTQSLGSDVALPTGRLGVYVPMARFDYILTGGGLPGPRLYPDAVGGASPSPSWVAVLDHQRDLQAAVQALPSCGGEVALSADAYALSSTLVLDKPNVSLRGQGRNTIITGPPNPSFDLVRIEAAGCRMTDLVVDGNATSAAADRSCVVITGASAQQVFLKNLLLRRASRNGLDVLNAGQVFAINCEGAENHRNGFGLLSDGAVPLLARLVACTARANDGFGAEIKSTGLLADSVTLLACLLDSGVDAADLNGLQVMGSRLQWTGVGFTAYHLLQAINVRGLMVEGCWFDGQVGGAASQALLGARMEACPGAAFVSNVGARLLNGLVSIDECQSAVEMGNKDLDSPAAPRIFGDFSTLFGLSRGVVELFRHAGPPQGVDWKPGTMFWDKSNPPRLRVVLDSSGTLKTVELQSM